MSTARRLISGSAASWARILFMMGSQVLFVPVFLSHWSVTAYGAWLAIQAFVYVLTILDHGHQTFLGFEFLKIGRDDTFNLGRMLSSGAIAGTLISVVQILIVLCLWNTHFLINVVGLSSVSDAEIIRDARLVILIEGFLWLLCYSVAGLQARLLEVFGYFPRMSLWTLTISVVKTTTPVIAVIFGADLLTAAMLTAASTIIASIPMYLDMHRLQKKHGVQFVRPSYKQAMQNFTRSMLLSVRIALENVRQQGIRLVIAPLAGTTKLTAFSTMRTISNVALQGLNSITYPLMPELSRFLHNRDQEKIEVGFGTLWVVLIAILAPGILLLQVVVEPLYSFWTRAQLAFDPLLFGMLSVSVLVYALAQPAIAIVTGNNLLKAQVVISVVCAVFIIPTLFLAIPVFGITAAGVTLLMAELIGSILYQRYATKWLSEKGLRWPSKPYFIAVKSIAISMIGILGIVFMPNHKWIVFSVSVIFLYWNCFVYYRHLPTIVKEKIRTYFTRTQPVL